MAYNRKMHNFAMDLTGSLLRAGALRDAAHTARMACVPCTHAWDEAGRLHDLHEEVNAALRAAITAAWAVVDATSTED